MNENRIIEKRAQIKILAYLLDHLCNSELSELGRKAVRGLMSKLNEEIENKKG